MYKRSFLIHKTTTITSEDSTVNQVQQNDMTTSETLERLKYRSKR